jgi:hypothetical protein
VLSWHAWYFAKNLSVAKLKKTPVKRFGGETEEDACHAILYDEPRFIDPDFMDEIETTAASLIRKVTFVLYSYSSRLFEYAWVQWQQRDQI